jgi:glutamine amidotransferase
VTEREVALAIVDYGAGNLHSLAKALAAPGTRITIESDARRAADRRRYDILALPGVGAFSGAAERLARARDAIRSAVDDGFPVIGICLGMQLLFESSAEGPGDGLGVISGVVRRLQTTRVPQIGWNTVESPSSASLTTRDTAIDTVYYANSYVCEPTDQQCVTAWSTYDGDRFAAAVRAGPVGNVVGMQFHPEKSSTPGVNYLRAVVAEMSAEGRR